MDEQNQPRVSKYNEAVSQVFRIDSLWKECKDAREKGFLKRYNHLLDCVWLELAADAGDKDFSKFNLYAKRIIANSKNRNILYQILMSKEIFLRRLQNAQGKGTAYREEDEGL